MTPLFVDTSFIIAIVNERDQYHQQAITLADIYNNRRLIITDAVLFEVGNALARKFKKESLAIIEHFFTSDGVEIVYVSQSLLEKGFMIYKKFSDKDWGLVDCVSFVVMQELGLTQALTADKHFVQAGFEALMYSQTR